MKQNPSKGLTLKNKERLFKEKCFSCNGKGYSEEITNTFFRGRIKIVEDCPYCEGKGYASIPVVDKRVKNKSRGII